MWLNIDIEMLNKIDLFGLAGGVSFMHETIDGKRIIKLIRNLKTIVSVK